MRWNHACEVLTGYAFDEVRSKPLWEFVLPPEEVASVRAGFHALCNGRERTTSERSWVTRMGQRRCIRWSNAVLRDSAGDVAYVIGTGIDLTALRQAEQDLSESAAKNQAILNTAIDGIITIDEAGYIESFNPAAERLFGYAAAEVLGQNIALLMPSPYREEHADYLRRYLRTGEKRIIGIGREVLGQRKDGTTFPVGLVVSEVPLGNQRLFTGFVRDLTRRKRVEQEMQRADRLALIGQLAAGLAHEIGTPLNVIAGNAELLRLELQAQESADEYLTTIITQTDRVTRLMYQLLALARHRQPVQEPVVVHEPLEQALNLLKTRFDREAITVVVEVPADLPPVRGVAAQLEQVLLNVLVNAWQAMPCGGVITVRAWVPDARYVRVVVQDTGSGIAPTDLAHVFEPFYTTKGERGTGLGLTVCRQLVENHGGRIQLESTPGVGTTVIIDLVQATAAR